MQQRVAYKRFGAQSTPALSSMLVFAPLAFALVSHVFASASAVNDQLSEQMAQLSVAQETLSPSPALQSAIAECDSTFEAYVGAAIELALLKVNPNSTEKQLNAYKNETVNSKSNAKIARAKFDHVLKQNVQEQISNLKAYTVVTDTKLDCLDADYQKKLKTKFTDSHKKSTSLSNIRDEARSTYLASFDEVANLVWSIELKNENKTTIVAQEYYTLGNSLIERVKHARDTWMTAYFDAAVAQKVAGAHFQNLQGIIDRNNTLAGKPLLKRKLFKDIESSV